jgi:hypothetical protein
MYRRQICRTAFAMSLVLVLASSGSAEAGGRFRFRRGCCTPCQPAADCQPMAEMLVPPPYGLTGIPEAHPDSGSSQMYCYQGDDTWQLCPAGGPPPGQECYLLPNGALGSACGYFKVRSPAPGSSK